MTTSPERKVHQSLADRIEQARKAAATLPPGSAVYLQLSSYADGMQLGLEECERLREALEVAADNECCDGCDGCAEVNRIAKSALGEVGT